MFDRTFAYFRAHGGRATIIRCAESVRRAFHLGHMHLFVCELPTNQSAAESVNSVLRIDGSGQSHPVYLDILSQLNLHLRRKDFGARFDAGSELWIATVAGAPVGFGWSIIGRTYEEHFFSVSNNEVHMFDFYIAPEFRGLGLNRFLMVEMLRQFSQEGIDRAHIECAAWNAAQIRSLQKTAFKRNGIASMWSILGYKHVSWHARGEQ